jgi:hypothetical protein
MPQDEVIARILEERSVSLPQWNAASDEQRSTHMAEMIEVMRAELREKAGRK